MGATFDAEQKQYLEGFFSGLKQRAEIPFLGQNADGQFTDNPAESVEQSVHGTACLLYTSPSPRDQRGSRMPSSA